MTGSSLNGLMIVAVVFLCLLPTLAHAFFGFSGSSFASDPFFFDSSPGLFHRLQHHREQQAREEAIWERCSAWSSLRLPFQDTRFHTQEMPEGYSVRAALPDLKTNDISVDIDERRGLLRIQAIQRPPTGCERLVRPDYLDRNLTLPVSSQSSIQWDGISASYADGILEVKVPKLVSKGQARHRETTSSQVKHQPVPDQPRNEPSPPVNDRRPTDKSTSTRQAASSSHSSKSPNKISLDSLLRVLSDFDREIPAASSSSSTVVRSPESAPAAEEATEHCRGPLSTLGREPQWYHTPLAACTSEERAKRLEAFDDGVIEI
jgi:HSP20 family molecular chaperone IbpA